MDKRIEVAAEDVVPLEAVASGVSGLRVLISNVFALISEAGWTLIDAGVNGSAGRIRRWASKHFGNAPPRSIVLTHAHFDHVGAIDELLESWNVPVYAHRDELPYLTGARSYPAPDPTVGGGLMARMAALYPRGPIDLANRVRELPTDGPLGELLWSKPGINRPPTSPSRKPGEASASSTVDTSSISRMPARKA